MAPAARPVLTALATAALVLAGAVAGPLAPATARPEAHPRSGDRVVSRDVRFEVENTNATSAVCLPDNQSHTLHARLVGPRSQVLGADAPRVNVLVHDLATGPWFWNLRSHPAYDYAGRLARAGETSLVLARLGYGGSRLADGNATCLGAQADMLHQVVQHLRSGSYRFTGRTRATPAAQHVVVHGHSVGSAIAELEAATFDDVDGLVLMSWSDQGASQRAVDEASRQSGRCLAGQDEVRTGAGSRDFRSLLFSTAPGAVQRAAVAHRGPNPCGDPLSLTQTLLALTLTTHQVEAPVLLLFGGRDALTRDGAAEQQAGAYAADVDVTTHVVKGAGSALPLERSAGHTRARVLRWLDRTQA